MASFKIGRIRIKNFKIFDDFELQLNEKSVTVLDGPNGFGKTTVFDAIELALRGKINRIDKIGNIQSGVLGNEQDNYLRDKRYPCYIFVELLGSRREEDFTVGVKYSYSSGRREKLASDFGRFFRKILPAWIDSGVELGSIDFPSDQRSIQNDLQTLLGSQKDLERFYNLYNYVQQEEPAFFLKQKESHRAAAISGLFDTEVENNEWNRVHAKLELVRREADKIQQQLLEIDTKISSLAIQPNESMDRPQSYLRLISEENPTQEWEKVKPFDGVSKEVLVQKLAAWKQDLEDLKLLKEKNTEFQSASKSQREAKFIDDRLQASYDETIRNILRAGFFLPQLNDIRSRYELEQKINGFVKQLDRETFIQSYTKIAWVVIQELAKTNLDLTALARQTEHLGTLLKSRGFLDTAVMELNAARENLRRKFAEIREKQDVAANPSIPIDECPLCGNKEWDDAQDVDEALDQQKDRLNSLIGDILTQVNELVELIFSTFVNPLRAGLILQYPQKDQQINEDFRREVLLEEPASKAVADYLAFCQSLELDLSVLWNTDFNTALGQQVAEKLISLKSAIGSKKVNFDLTVIQELGPIASKFGFQNEQALERITLEAINSKIGFLDNEYRTSALDFLRELEVKKAQLSGQHLNLTALGTKLETIGNVYKEEIKLHQKQMIQDIEIPFYIFSGKILQDVQRGSGIFINTGQTASGSDTAANQIRFQATPSTDQDAYYNLSSGQLSALVLAYLLTLNKKYGQDGLKTILIDDPIQTMDEINMASFVDLLRNEFPDHQIIISTHEPMFSTYIRFKFEEFGKSTQPLNLKDIRYEMSNRS